MVQLGAIAGAVLRALEDAIVHEPHRALTVGELTEAVGVDRPMLDAALGEIDDAGLIRLRGDISTHRSYVELTDPGQRAVDGPAPPPKPAV